MQSKKANNRVLSFVDALQKVAWRAFRPRTRGVKVMLFNPRGEIVLIRNTYGRQDLFVLPGGGVRPFENPADAARREIREELGLQLGNLRLCSQHRSSAEGKRDTIFLFQAHIEAIPEIDDREVLDARFVRLRNLPRETSPATRRRVEEYLGVREPDGSW